MNETITQTQEEFRVAYHRFVDLAKRGTWVPVDSSNALRLTSMDSPGENALEAILAFRKRVKAETGVDLNLVGGGYGCFDMGFEMLGGDADGVGKLIEGDPLTQKALNEAAVHTARTRTREVEHSYCGMYDLTMLVATNRIPLDAHWDSELGVCRAFGEMLDDALHFRIAELSVLDFTKRQDPPSLCSRIWRVVSLQWLVARRSNPLTVLVRNLTTLANHPDFHAQIRARGDRGAVVLVHGYANDFDTALRTYAINAYRTKLQGLGLLPILFSWPSAGNPVTYSPDVTKAENSGRSFLDAAHSVLAAAQGKDVDLVAHSHGNKIVVSALSDSASTVSRTPFKRIVLIEPDVSTVYIEQRVKDLLAASKRIALYHSKNDLAIRLAEKLHSDIRAGRAGIAIEKIDAELADRIEVIDASSVAAGFTKHAPHIESAPVIRDIHDLLEGKPAKSRFNIQKAKTVGYWEMANPLG